MTRARTSRRRKRKTSRQRRGRRRRTSRGRRRRTSRNPIPPAPTDRRQQSHWVERTFPVGTPVVFRGGGIALGDWEVPDGVKGEVVEVNFGSAAEVRELRIRLYPPLIGDPRFTHIERKLEQEGKGKRVEDLDVYVSAYAVAAGLVQPLIDTWAQYQQPYMGRKLKPNVTPSVSAPDWRNQRAVKDWIHTTYAVGTPVSLTRYEGFLRKGRVKGVVRDIDDGRRELYVRITDIRDTGGAVARDAIDIINDLNEGRGLSYSWMSLVEGIADLEPMVDNWVARRRTSRPAKRHQLPRSQRSWLKPNIPWGRLTVPSPPPQGSPAKWHQWYTTTFSRGTPVKYVGAMNASWWGGMDIPDGARGVVVQGPAWSSSQGEDTMCVEILDARDPSGLQVPIVGQVVEEPVLMWEPLVDNWKTQRRTSRGRHALPRSQRSWLKPNIPWDRLSVPPPSRAHSLGDWDQWLSRTFQVGDTLKLVRARKEQLRDPRAPMTPGPRGGPPRFNELWVELEPGVRLEITGRPFYDGLTYRIPVQVLDARNKWGEREFFVGWRGSVPASYMEPLVDHWSGAQGRPGGRHALPRSQRSWLKPNAKRRSSSKDINRLVRRARKQGWTVETTRGNHLRWTPPDPERNIVITASTPSDYRALKNIKARLRRSGLKLSA